MDPRNSPLQRFDRVAADYDVARPCYPPALFDTLIERTNLRGGAKALEIGPGTGQATRSMASRGFDIVAVEPGPNLAERCRRNLAGFCNVRVVEGAFEEVVFEAAAFDLVYGATSLHWVREGFRFSKPFELLRPGGFVAAIDTHHISDGKGDRFYHASQPIFRKYQPQAADRAGHVPPALTAVAPTRMDRDLFEPISFDVFPVTVTYEAGEYARLLGTYSPVLAMTQAQRQAFLDEMAVLIHRRFGGAIEKCYGMSLTIGRRC